MAGRCTCPVALSDEMRSEGSGSRDCDAGCSGVASEDGAKTCASRPNRYMLPVAGTNQTKLPHACCQCTVAFATAQAHDMAYAEPA